MPVTTVDEAREWTRRIVEERGYLVVAYFPPYPEIGTVLNPFNYDIGQPFCIFSETDKSDWKSQVVLARKSGMRVRRDALKDQDLKFFRAVTD